MKFMHDLARVGHRDDGFLARLERDVHGRKLHFAHADTDIGASRVCEAKGSEKQGEGNFFHNYEISSAHHGQMKRATFLLPVNLTKQPRRMTNFPTFRWVGDDALTPHIRSFFLKM
ncbi:hypothetical protein [Deinococcus xinjiangensis]|uniref:hypothetical protein n=1 Tax=Deinococcus xinjiangensis TaxID=457454 RepID=UPI00336564E2